MSMIENSKEKVKNCMPETSSFIRMACISAFLHLREIEQNKQINLEHLIIKAEAEDAIKIY